MRFFLVWNKLDILVLYNVNAFIFAAYTPQRIFVQLSNVVIRIHHTICTYINHVSMTCNMLLVNEGIEIALSRITSIININLLIIPLNEYITRLRCNERYSRNDYEIRPYLGLIGGVKTRHAQCTNPHAHCSPSEILSAKRGEATETSFTDLWSGNEPRPTDQEARRSTILSE